MKIKNYNPDEFEVYCKKCNMVIIVEGPQDLKKDIEKEREIFYLKCPICSNEIKFNGVLEHTLSPEFKKRVKLKEKSYLDTMLKASKEFNKEFKGTIDKI